MTTNLPSATITPAFTTPERLRIGAAGLFAAAVVITCAWLALNGQPMQAAAAAEKLRALDEENKDFCSAFGVGPGTSRYTECTAGLMRIRASQEQLTARGFDLF
jgi:hypothetical protein